MYYQLLALSLLLACYRPMETISSPTQREPDDKIIVGRIELIPPLQPQEQQVLPRNYPAFQNRVFLIPSEVPREVYSAQNLRPGDSLSSVSVLLNQTFFLKTRKHTLYLLLGIIVLKSYLATNAPLTGPGFAGYQQTISLPANLTLDVRPEDEAIYIGTLQYHRDLNGFIYLTQVKDEYTQAEKEFYERFGGEISLRKALVSPPAVDPAVLAHGPTLPPEPPSAEPSPGPEEAAGGPSSSVAKTSPPVKGGASLPAAGVRTQQSHGGGLWTYDAPLLTSGAPASAPSETKDEGEILDLSAYYQRSPALSFTLALGSSLAGYALLRPSLVSGNNLTFLISAGLLTVGPGAGHLYAGEAKHGLLTAGLRLLAGGIALLDFATPGRDELAWAALAGGGALGVYDILDSLRAPVRRKRRFRRVKLVSLQPAPLEAGDGSASLGLFAFGRF